MEIGQKLYTNLVDPIRLELVISSSDYELNESLSQQFDNSVSLGLSNLWLWFFSRMLVGVLTGVLVGVFTGVLLGVFTGVLLGVFTGVLVGVFTGVLLGVFTGVLVGVLTGVLVGVLMGVLTLLLLLFLRLAFVVLLCFLFLLFIMEGLKLLLHFLIDLFQGDCDILWILKLVGGQELSPFSLKANWLIFAKEASVSQVEIAGRVLGGVLYELACESGHHRMNIRLGSRRLGSRRLGGRRLGGRRRGGRGRGLLSVSESSLLS